MEKSRSSGDSRRFQLTAEQPDSLLSLHHKAVEELSNDNYEAALTTLKRTEEVLEVYTTQGLQVDQDLVLCTLNNIAVCHQKQEATDQCAAYLEACLAPMHGRMTGGMNELAWDIKQTKYQSIIHIQLCALLSQMGNHVEALAKAKQAARLSRFSLEATLQAYKLLMSKYQSYRRKRMAMPETLHQNYLLAQRAFPTLKCLEEFFTSGEIVLEEDPQMRSVLGVKTFADWVYLLSISDMMVIQPLTIEDVKQKPQIRAEFAKDLMLHKVAHLAVAYFCISTELKFLRGKQAFNPERDKDGEILHNKAVVLLEALFPQECPLLTHISQTYEKRFVSELHEIPEASESFRPVRKSSAKAKTSRSRKSNKSHDFSSLPQITDKRSNTPLKAPSSRASTRSQSSLRPAKASSRKIRVQSEPFINGQFQGKQRSKSRMRSESKLRDRRNRSAELFRSGENEGSFPVLESSEDKAGQFVS